MRLGLHRKTWRSQSFLETSYRLQNEIWSILILSSRFSHRINRLLNLRRKPSRFVQYNCDICDTSCDENLTFFIKNNGFDPHFETTFKIGQIGIPEVSFLKIRVFDEDGPLDKDDFGEFFISDDDKLAFYIQLPSHIFLYILWKRDTVQLSCMIKRAKSLKWQLYSWRSNFEFQCCHPMFKKKCLPIEPAINLLFNSRGIVFFTFCNFI